MSVDMGVFERAKKGDPEAREQAFEANTGLIWSCVRRYAGLLEKEDLFQIGAIGLIKAIDRFDPEYGTAFSTYAIPLILGEIRRYLRDNGAVKVSRRLREVSIAVRRLSSKKKAQTGKEPTMEELAQELEIDVDLLCQALEATQPVLYFEDVPHISQSAAGEPQSTGASGQHSFVESFDLRDAVSGLDEAMKSVIEGRFFHGKTQHEIAGELNLSQAHISRLEKRALLLLRQILQPKQ